MINFYIPNIDIILGNSAILPVYFKEMTLLTAIHLSFKFSHKKYEKRCNCCDKRMKHYFHKDARKENKKRINQIELEQRLLTEDHTNMT